MNSKAAPILKISISGGTYNSIASYHSHVVNSTCGNNSTFGGNDHNNKNNGDCSSSYGSEQSLSQRTRTPDPVSQKSGDDSFEERIRKIERKYQERLDVTKHVLEAKVDQYNQDQMAKLRQSYQKEMETQQKLHQVQMAQVEEKIRKEVDGLKRHWIEDTQKPLKKQKLRRVEPSPRSMSPSSPRKDQSLDSEDGLFNRLNCKLEEIARVQKKELLHMITVEMIKTEKVLRQELKDMTEGLTKDSSRSRKVVPEKDRTKGRPARAQSRLSTSDVIQPGFPGPEAWKSVQQEVRMLRSEVRRLLRGGSPRKNSTSSSLPVTNIDESDPTIPKGNIAAKPKIVQLELRSIRKRNTTKGKNLAKFKGKEKKSEEAHVTSSPTNSARSE